MTEAEEERTRPTPGFATQQVVFEQVEGGHFLVWDRIEEKFIVNSNDVWRSYTIEGTHYIPLQRLPWPSVTTIEFYQNEEQLFNNVKQFFTDHLDVQNELFYDIYAAFVLASWRVEDFKVVPYLFFLWAFVKRQDKSAGMPTASLLPRNPSHLSKRCFAVPRA